MLLSTTNQQNTNILFVYTVLTSASSQLMLKHYNITLLKINNQYKPRW